MFASPDEQSENSDIRSSSAVPIPCGTEKMFARMIRYSSCGKSQSIFLPFDGRLAALLDGSGVLAPAHTVVKPIVHKDKIISNQLFDILWKII